MAEPNPMGEMGAPGPVAAAAPLQAIALGREPEPQPEQGPEQRPEQRREQGRDQRRETRYPVHGEAEVLVSGGMSMFRGRVVNLSASGCYVQTVAWVRLAPQTAVELAFVVKGSVVRARAEARFSESKVGLGLRFSTMEEQMRRRLDTVLAGLQKATVEQAEVARSGRSVLDALTETATARADAGLRTPEEQSGQAAGGMDGEDVAIAALQAMEPAGSGVAPSPVEAAPSAAREKPQGMVVGRARPRADSVEGR